MIIGDDPLTRFLRDLRDRPFDWRYRNCLLMLADWIVIRRGIDPGSAWRGRCATALEALEVNDRAGGAVALVESCVAPLGIKRTGHPKRGDIAVVEDPIVGRMGAIILAPPDSIGGGTLARLVERGLMISRPVVTPIVTAWSV